MAGKRGLLGLQERVLKRDMCSLCGACASLCPYLISWNGRIVKMDECDLEEGRCFSYCPRTEVDLDRVHRSAFGMEYRDITIGPFREICIARIRDQEILKNAQAGGVVSGLMALALQEGVMDAAVLTKRDEKQIPQGCVAHSRSEVLACSGSSYVAAPTLEALNRGPWEATERVGFVGVPCQILALRKMISSPFEKRPPLDRIGILVGLFCTWALRYEPFMAYLRKMLNGETISRFDITPPPERLLKVTTSRKTWEIPLDEIRAFIRPSCTVCVDMTSELADLSVGTVEDMEEWNTLIVRTEQGARLVDLAREKGLLETVPLAEARLAHLKEASLLKKSRALSALEESGELEEGYLVLSKELIREILPGKEEAQT